MRDGEYKAQWQAKGAEVSLPDETYIFEHEILGTERDPLRFRLDKLLGWCLVDGSGSYIRNGKKIPVPPRETIIDSDYDVYARLLSREWLDRAEGIWILGLTRDGRARDKLLERLNDPIWYVRRFAVLSLSRLRDHRDIPVLLKFLEDENPELQRVAAIGLRQYYTGSESPVPEDLTHRVTRVLKGKLEGTDRWLLRAAAETLETITPGLAEGLLQKQVSSGNEEVKSIALVTLAELGDSIIREKAEKFLESDDHVISMAGLEALLLIDDAESRARILHEARNSDLDPIRFLATKWVTGLPETEYDLFLIKQLSDRSTRLREEVARILNYRGWQPATSGELTRYHLAAGHWQKLNELENPDLEFLCSALGDRDKPTRLEAARLLGRRGDAEVLPCLKYRLESWKETPYHDSRAEIISALAALGDQQSIRTVQHLLSDQSETVRASAIRALGRLGDDGQPFEKWLTDDKPTIRAAAADALTALGWVPETDVQRLNLAVALQQWDLLDTDDQIVRDYIFTRCMKEKDEQVRIAGCELLGTVKTRESTSVLIRALGDSSYPVRDAAVLSLGNMGDFAVPLLIRTLGSRKIESVLVIRALGLTGSGQIIPIVLRYLTDSDWNLRVTAHQALSLAGYVPETDRARAVFYLAGEKWVQLVSLGDTGWKLLEKEFDTGSFKNREIIVSGLRFMRNQRSVSMLIRILANWDVDLQDAAADSLSKMGRIAVLQLLETLKTGKPRTRRAVVKILGNIGGKDAVDGLAAALLTDKNWKIRRESALALLNIGDESAEPQLVYALSDKSTDVRTTAKKCLIQLKWLPRTEEEKKVFRDL